MDNFENKKEDRPNMTANKRKHSRVTIDESLNTIINLPPKNIKDYYWTEEDSEIANLYAKERKKEITEKFSREMDEVVERNSDNINNIKNSNNSNRMTLEDIFKDEGDEELFEIGKVATKEDNIILTKENISTKEEKSQIKKDYYEINLEQNRINRVEMEMNNKFAEDAITRAAMEIEKEDTELNSNGVINSNAFLSKEIEELNNRRHMEIIEDYRKRRVPVENRIVEVKGKDSKDVKVKSNRVESIPHNKIESIPHNKIESIPHNKSITCDKNIEQIIADAQIHLDQEGLIEFQDKIVINFECEEQRPMAFQELKKKLMSVSVDVTKEEITNTNSKELKNNIKNTNNSNNSSLVSERVKHFNQMLFNQPNVAKKNAQNKKTVIQKIASMFQKEEKKENSKIIQEINCFKVKENPFVRNDLR